MMLSMEDGGGLSGYLFPAVFLFLGIGAFLYANVVFTPEIISVNEQMALDLRQVEIRKLLSAVQKHIEAEKDLEDLRIPLEASLNLTIEEYVSKVDGGKDLGFTSADKDLANVLRVMSQ